MKDTRLKVTLKNLDTGCDFVVEGVDFIKVNKDWIEVNFNIPENDYFKPYLYQRTQYDLVCVQMYKI